MGFSPAGWGKSDLSESLSCLSLASLVYIAVQTHERDSHGSDIKHSGAGHRRGAPWRLLCTLRVLRDSSLQQAVERLNITCTTMYTVYTCWISRQYPCRMRNQSGSGTADTGTLCLLGSVLLSCFQQVALACSMNDTDSAMMSMILLKLPGTGFRS